MFDVSTIVQRQGVTLAPGALVVDVASMTGAEAREGRVIESVSGQDGWLVLASGVDLRSDGAATLG